MDDVSTKLHEAEGLKTKWVPVGEIIIDSLPQHIAEMKVGWLHGLMYTNTVLSVITRGVVKYDTVSMCDQEN